MSKKLMRIRTVSGLVSLAAVILATLATTSCGDVVRTGRAPVMLVVNSISAGTTASAFLLSDVLREPDCVPATVPRTICPTVTNDPGSATLAVLMKDVTVSPSTNNDVTVTHYRVNYSRADGHNTPGVDVPFPFDAAVTATVVAGTTSSVGLELVRTAAKLDPPLAQLASSPNVISTTATVTLYGVDQVGNDVSATGSILIQFANFADK
jgi:hypothetical protein